jgi:hypothetical protein
MSSSFCIWHSSGNKIDMIISMLSVEFCNKNLYIKISFLAFLLAYVLSEWLLFYTNSAIFQLYHGENKLIFNEMMMNLHFVLDQHAEVGFYSASSLKLQSVDRHVAPLGHIILIPTSLCYYSLMLQWRSNKYHLNSLWFDTTVTRTHNPSHSRPAR